MNDLKQDVHLHKQLLANSERKREELQVHITETSIAIHKDTEEHVSQQQQLILESEQLKREIQSLKQYQAQKDREHAQFVEDLNQQHKYKVDVLTKEHFDRTSQMSNEHQDRVERLQKDNQNKLNQVIKTCL